MKYNVLFKNGHEYNMECIWRNTKNDTTKDSKGELFPYPSKHLKAWSNMENFIYRLDALNKFLDIKEKYKLYEKPKKCLLCHKNNITTKRYIFKNKMWEDGLIHYIKYHNIDPSLHFKRFIFSNNMSNYVNISRHREDDKNNIMILNIIKKLNNKYVVIEKNQMLILDALMIHGGYVKRYIDQDMGHTRYSEHAGLLDFENGDLSKIVVSGKTNKIDTDDDEIYLPSNINETFNYEYIFHTHPPTPKPGGRAIDGVLYEYPSMWDIFHFIDHHNGGKVLGSLIVAPEGLYNIRKFSELSKKIEVDEDMLYKKYWIIFDKLQEESIDKYGTTFSTHIFYSRISQDTSYIKRFNHVLNEFDIQVDFFSRKKDKLGRWYIDTVFLPFCDR